MKKRVGLSGTGSGPGFRTGIAPRSRGDLHLASNWTAGTLAAVQYATQPSYARELCQRLRAAAGELPRHYQVVVRLKLENLYPIDISYVTHHVLNTLVMVNLHGSQTTEHGNRADEPIKTIFGNVCVRVRHLKGDEAQQDSEEGHRRQCEAEHHCEDRVVNDEQERKEIARRCCGASHDVDPNGAGGRRE